METALGHTDCPRKASRHQHLKCFDSEAIMMFAGFASLVSWVQIYENYLLLNNVGLFNYCLYGFFIQIAVFGLVTVLGASFIRKFNANMRSNAAVAGGLTGALGIATSMVASTGLTDLIGSLLVGLSSAVLSLSWSFRLAERDTKTVCASVAFAFLLAMFCCLACQAAGETVALILAVALPLATGLASKLDARQQQSSRIETAALTQSHATDDRRENEGCDVPWPFLVTLGACCLMGSFFVGLAINPYIFQSNSVSHYWFLFAFAACVLLLAWALFAHKPNVQTAFIGALILLLLGLFLFSSGVLGSIIMPLGLIAASQTCCMALGWITLSILARPMKATRATILGIGLLICNGALGRSTGILVNNSIAPSFPDIALAASIAIVSFSMLYACATAIHGEADKRSSRKAALSANAADRQFNENVRADVLPQTPDSKQAHDDFSSIGAKALVELQKGTSLVSTDSALYQTNEIPVDDLAGTEAAEASRALFEKKLSRYGLTQQESRIALLILEDKTYFQIATICSISERTVKFHAKNIYQKVGVDARRNFAIKLLAE